MSTVSGLLMALAGPIAKKVLVSLGMGVVSYIGITAAIQSAVSASQGALGGLAGDYAAIAAIGGFFSAMGILAGAFVAAGTLVAFKKLGMITG